MSKPTKDSAQLLVSEFSSALTGIPRVCKLEGIRNVTRDCLVEYVGKSVGPLRRKLECVRNYPDPLLYQRYTIILL